MSYHITTVWPLKTQILNLYDFWLWVYLKINNMQRSIGNLDCRKYEADSKSNVTSLLTKTFIHEIQELYRHRKELSTDYFYTYLPWAWNHLFHLWTNILKPALKTIRPLADESHNYRILKYGFDLEMPSCQVCLQPP